MNHSLMIPGIVFCINPKDDAEVVSSSDWREEQDCREEVKKIAENGLQALKAQIGSNLPDQLMIC